MATIKTKFMVGLFVIIGLSLAVVTIIWLGMSHYFEEGRFYVAYFDESVQGLEKDSPVKYRGVSIGRVHGIDVAPDANLIQVVLKIETSIELDDTIVAQLKSVGITGIMFVELDKVAPEEPVLTQHINFPAKYPVINTKPSNIKQFFDAVNEALMEFKKFDISDISDSLKFTLAKIDQTIEKAQVQRLSDQLIVAVEQMQTILEPEKWTAVLNKLDSALKSIQEFADSGNSAVLNLNTTIGNVDRAINASEENIVLLINDLRASVKQIESLLENSGLLISKSDTEIMKTLARLNLALQHYEKAGKRLNTFLERIADQPSQLIFAEPPENVDIETKKKREK